MSNKAQRLPNEILIQIFEQAPKAAVYQCISVCKAWETAALQVYYKELSINKPVVKALKEIFAHKMTAPPDLSLHLPLVKSLDICQTDGRTLISMEFSKLLIYMPNLRTIDFSGERTSSIYLHQFKIK